MAWPPRQEVLFAVSVPFLICIWVLLMIPPRPEGKKERKADRKAFHEILFPEVHLFLDDITLQEDGSLTFGAELSALLKLRFPDASMDRPKRSIREKVTSSNKTCGKAKKALRRKEDGYTRPSLEPLVADFIPANVQHASRTDITDFASEIRIRLTLSEMVISSKDWSWGEDGKLTVIGLAATTILSGAQLWIPKEDPVLRNYRAMRCTSIRTRGQRNLLWTLLSKRNRVWIVKCEASCVKIEFLLTEELDDARMAHDKGISRLNAYSNLGNEEYKRPCCNDKFGGPSLCGRLETLLLVGHKAAMDEEKAFARSPFLNMFENSRPRTEENSLLEQAILALQNVDMKVHALQPSLQIEEIELRRRNLDVTSTMFDLAVHRLEEKKSNRIFDFFNSLRRSQTGVAKNRGRAQSVPHINVTPKEVFEISRRMTVIPVTSSSKDEGPTLTTCCGIRIPNKDKGPSSPSKEIWEQWSAANLRPLFTCQTQYLCHTCIRTPKERRKSTYQNLLPGEVNGPKCIFHRSDWATWNPPIRVKEVEPAADTFLEILEGRRRVEAWALKEKADAEAKVKKEEEDREVHSPPMEVSGGKEEGGWILHRSVEIPSPPVGEKEVSVEETYRGEHYVRCSVSLIEDSESEEGDCPDSPDTVPCKSVRSVEIGDEDAVSLKE